MGRVKILISVLRCFRFIILIFYLIGLIVPEKDTILNKKILDNKDYINSINKLS